MSRFFYALLIFILWSLLGMWWYYSCEMCNQNEVIAPVKEEVTQEKVIPAPPIAEKIPEVHKGLVIKNKSGNALFKFDSNFGLYERRMGIETPDSIMVFKDSIFKYLNNHQNEELVITGWRNSSESDSLGNFGIRRATIIKNMLANSGVNPDKIVVKDSVVDFEYTNSKYLGGIDLQFNEISEQRAETINKGITNKILYTKFNSRNFVPDNTLQAYASELKNYLNQNPAKKVLITGHTDATGDPNDNIIIGRDRATNVMRYLVSEGIPKDKFTIDSKGITEPIADNTTEEGRAKNRRIEIKVN